MEFLHLFKLAIIIRLCKWKVIEYLHCFHFYYMSQIIICLIYNRVAKNWWLVVLYYDPDIDNCVYIVNMAATKSIIADLNQREKLNEKNYNVWHRKIQYVLEEQDMLETIT